MARTNQWADNLWPRVMVIFPDVNAGQACAMLNGLKKKFDQDTVTGALDRLDGRVFEPGKMWPVMSNQCAEVVKERARNFGSAGKGPAKVERFA